MNARNGGRLVVGQLLIIGQAPAEMPENADPGSRTNHADYEQTSEKLDAKYEQPLHAVLTPNSDSTDTPNSSLQVDGIELLLY